MTVVLHCRTKGRHGTKYTEEMEDQALLADEDTGGERAGHRLSVQPSVIKGGQMRKYQMEGLNWLIHLYDNGINGILADEMVSVVWTNAAWSLYAHVTSEAPYACDCV